MTKITTYIPASPQRVFSAMTAYEKYPQWAPGCEECTVVSSKGSTTSVEMVVNTIRRVRFGLRFEAEPNQLVQFELISGKDLKKYSGVYRLVKAADGKGTVVFAELDLEVASMPRFLTEGMAKKGLGELCMALKAYVESLPDVDNVATSQVRAGASPSAPPAPRRARRLLQIVKGQAGYRVSFLGQAFTVKKIEGNVFNP